MAGPNHRIALLGRALRQPDLIGELLRTARNRLWSDLDAYGLRRDLDVPHVAPDALIDISVRRLRDSDVPAILGTDDSSLSSAEKFDRLDRRRLLESGAGSCFVAVTADDEPCYVQWLFGHQDNDFIQRFFPATFPILDPDTALLENAFTPASFRGQRIMSAAMARIAEEARSLDARYVVTFVSTDNTPSLKGCDRAGFGVYVNRRQRFRGFRRSVEFRPAQADATK